jgi:ATP-dependent helicase HrpA
VTEAGPADLQERLQGLTVRDRHRLAARVRRVSDPHRPVDLGRLEREIVEAEGLVARRLAAVPRISYPEELPVTRHRDDVMEAIRANPVVVVAGETGSGKTTQIPKMCLELGRGIAGLIGHTQPRRIAARTVAERVAAELGVELGGAIGYAVRFNDRVGPDTLVKLMTDGILLAELPRDRLLTRYDTIIIDEAHERSLNIDFLLGYLAQLLPQRPDLKVIVTSATIDTARFSEHFGGAPVVEVSGRTYPVEIRYEPVVDDADDRDRDQTEAIVDAVGELCAEGPGDVLVFLSGEREIRDTAEALRNAELPGTEILPLYARLSTAEQHRVFRPHTGRRVVLATNVAETSITVPGIRSVVDPGTARISRYSFRTKVQRLPIEAVSQASANQRAGRCGRLGPGTCIRLYSEEDFASRPEFTDPEIARTNLASVILQMAALGLGDIEAFPFVDPPDRRQVTAAVDLLDELGALSDGGHAGAVRLTPIGRRLARLPIDPRLGRMVLEADRNGCLREVTVIAAGLSIQDPRESPSDKRQAAAEQHRRFADAESDFLSFLALWDHVHEQQRALSSSAFRRLCRREFINFQRIREWEDLCSQLRQVTRDLGFRPTPAPGDTGAIHRSILAGLLSHIGARDDDATATRPRPAGRKGPARPARPAREYLGARNTRFTIGSGSGLAKSPPRWVMAAELVETDRLWARTAARIEPRWAEILGAHLLRRSYSEPSWDPERATTVALERVTLYGVPIVTERRVDYAAVDPALARDLFVRHALVDGDWATHHRFVEANQSARQAVIALEDRVRRRDLLVDDDTLHDLYDERVPPGVVTGRQFDRWWRDARRSQPDLLSFTPGQLVAPGAGRIRFDDYPDEWVAGDLRLPLSYVYDPLADDDGVTVRVPLAALNRLEPAGFEWHIAGHRPALVSALIRSLPKDARRAFVPVPDHAAAFLAESGPPDGPLLRVLADWLARRSGVAVSPAAWDLSQLPGYLRLSFAVLDGSGRRLASSKDLAALERRLRGPIREAVARAASEHERPPANRWAFGTVQRVVRTEIGGQPIDAFPGLVGEGDGVAVRIFADSDERDRALWAATRRLLLVNTNPPVARAAGDLPNDAKLALAHVPHASLAAFLEDCAGAAVDQLLKGAGGPVWDETAWHELLAAVRSGVAETTTRVVTRAGLAVFWAHAVTSRLDRMAAPLLAPSVDDMRTQVDRLVFPGFVTATGSGRLIDLIRYLKAIERRLAKVVDDPMRDREKMRPIRRLDAELRERTGPQGWTSFAEVADIHWMIEELRVSTWAQSLGTAQPVSESRIRRALARLT